MPIFSQSKGSAYVLHCFRGVALHRALYHADSCHVNSNDNLNLDLELGGGRAITFRQLWRTYSKFLFWGSENVLWLMFPWLRWPISWLKVYFFQVFRSKHTKQTVWISCFGVEKLCSGVEQPWGWVSSPIMEDCLNSGLGLSGAAFVSNVSWPAHSSHFWFQNNQSRTKSLYQKLFGHIMP